MTNAITNSQAAEPSWWRNAYCWMVFIGPLIVVIAALFTMVLAYRGADPVLPEYLHAATEASVFQHSSPTNSLPVKPTLQQK